MPCVSDRALHRLTLLLALAGVLMMIAWQVTELRIGWTAGVGEFTAPRPQIEHWPHHGDPTRRS